MDGDEFIFDAPFKENPRHTSYEFRVGKPTFEVDDFFKGQLDELRISNVARYKSQFVPQRAAFAADTNTLALWHFDESLGADQLKDASGNGNTLRGKFLVKTPAIVEPQGPPQPGGWYGTTSQGLPVSFEVSNDSAKVECFTLTVKIPEVTFTKTYVSPTDIVGNQFKFSGAENFSGKFTSNTNATGGWNGTFEILTGGIPPTSKKVPSSGSWTAAHVVPDPGVGPLQFVSFKVDDAGFRATGDGDGKAEEGETINLQVKIRNTGKDAFVVRGELSTKDGDIEKITPPDCHTPLVQSGKEETLEFQVKMAQPAKTHDVSFALKLTAGNGQTPWTSNFQTPISGSKKSDPGLTPAAIIQVQPPQTAAVGSQFTVPVTVKGAQNLTGFQFDLTFAPSVLEAIHVEEGDFLRSDGTSTLWVDSKINQVQGVIKRVAAVRLNGTGKSGDGTLALIAFRAKSPGKSPLSLTKVELSNPDAQTIPHQAVSGEVTVEDSKTVVRLTPKEQTVNVNDSIEWRVTVETSRTVAGYQLVLNFDPKILQFQSAQEGEFLKQNKGQTFWKDPVSDKVKGVVQLAAARTSAGGVSGEGVLAILRLKAVAQGTSPVAFQKQGTLISDSNAQVIVAELIPASVVVKPSRPGDVNGDLVVNILDMVLVGQNLGRKVGDGETPEWTKIGDGSLPDRADVNDDGEVNIRDLVLVTQNFSEVNPAPAAPFVTSVDPLAAVQMGRIRPLKDGVFEADLDISSDVAIHGFWVDLTFPPSLEVLGVSEMSALRMDGEKTYFYTTGERDQGFVRIAVTRLGQQGIRAVGNVAKVRFRVTNPQAQTPIQLGISQAQLVDEQGNLIIPRVKGRTFAAEEVVIPETSRLLPNYPNPFNPETWIPFELAQGSQVTIQIYNSLGELVRELELGYRHAGMYLNKERAAYWDGRNRSGEQVASGLYFYTLKAGSFSATRKMIVVR